MKKTYSVIIGLIAGLIVVLFIDQLFKGLVVFIIGVKDVSLLFRGIRLSVEFPAENIKNFFLFTVIIISPFIFSLLMVEYTLIWIRKISNDLTRTSIIIFQLINIGYLIFAAVLGIFSIILQSTFSTDWSLLLSHGALSFNQKLIFMFLIMFVLLGYLNVLTKRIRKSIPVINKQKTSKSKGKNDG